jgi:hypothetical protein
MPNTKVKSTVAVIANSTIVAPREHLLDGFPLVDSFPRFRRIRAAAVFIAADLFFTAVALA